MWIGWIDLHWMNEFESKKLLYYLFFLEPRGYGFLVYVKQDWGKKWVEKPQAVWDDYVYFVIFVYIHSVVGTYLDKVHYISLSLVGYTHARS